MGGKGEKVLPLIQCGGGGMAIPPIIPRGEGGGKGVLKGSEFNIYLEEGGGAVSTFSLRGGFCYSNSK